ncbi:MAG TPA: MinD/ParA family protein [Anaerolineales bacterium]|nr:MinD/ParA family protein [Anaerolineales bacterium]HNA88025.1 MinD/ParA family protein [Anaerolineales bacterium]HNB35571.1 MinD/ParA family protein [Anaerolineales bacterium]HNC07179.1 MinD/ParA family protein [Anaerolineales bacterium]
MSDGKIVSIHSFRGGTGKSNTTANLAAQVAMTGKRVGVVDTDIQSPGIHVLFGLDEQKMGKTLNDFLHGTASIREVGLRVGDNPREGEGRSQLKGKDLFLFPSSINGAEISKILKEGIDFNLLNEGLQTAISEFNLDYLFIDTHPGLNEETLLSIATSDVLIIILRPDQQDVQGTAVTVDIARSLDVPNLLLLVNKALPKHDASAIKADIEAKFEATVTSVLPLSFDIAENASKDLFSLSHPDHEWSKALKQVVPFILNAK